MSVTYTKLFSSITESTIWCESAETRIVWITMLAMCDRYGRVWASIPGLAKRSQVTLIQTEEALQTLLSPDKYSRTKDHEGRRIIEIDGGWGLLNHEKYRNLADEADRREYKRKWIADKRNETKPVDTDVDKCRQVSKTVDKCRNVSIDVTHTDPNASSDAKELKESTKEKPSGDKSPNSPRNKKPSNGKRFIPPSIADVSEYVKTRPIKIDPEAFVNFYASKGWQVGSNGMKDWKAAVRTWERKEKPQPTPQHDPYGDLGGYMGKVVR